MAFVNEISGLWRNTGGELPNAHQFINRMSSCPSDRHSTAALVSSLVDFGPYASGLSSTPPIPCRIFRHSQALRPCRHIWSKRNLLLLQASLMKLIRDAAASAGGQGSAGGTVSIPRLGRLPVSALVAPFRPAPMTVGTQRPPSSPKRAKRRPSCRLKRRRLTIRSKRMPLNLSQ